MQGPRFPEAPRRLPESWRVNLKPLTGSPIFSHIFPILTRGYFQESKIGHFLAKPDTQLRVSPCFGSLTQPACPFPNPRIFPVRGTQLHPRVKQRSTSPRLPPQERQNHFPSPCVNRRDRPNWHSVSDTPRQNEISHRVCKHGTEYHDSSLSHVLPFSIRTCDDHLEQ